MTARSLHLAKDLRLPLELVTESVAILAKRRAGKSTTARRLAEQLHKAGQQVVVVDPKGDWWGLRFARDGKSPGLPFVVLGGEHGDVPLEVGSGELVAKLVVTERVTAVLDLSKFRKHEVATFMTAFMETLYRLKAQEQYRTPVMLVVDEADAIAPQKPQRGEERMLGAAEDLVRRGGQRGIGVMMITQRSAVLNKNVLTQCGILIVLRTIAPQDLAAMDAWIDVHGTVEERKQLMASLPSLPTGEGWVWAPGWPDAGGIFVRTPFLLPETFDSSATPKAGEKRVQPKNAADVDLEAFRREMAATIERAKLEDPRELRKENASLRTQLTTLQKKAQRAPVGAPVVKEVPKRVEVPVLKDGQLKRLEQACTRLVHFGESVVAVGREITAALTKLQHPPNGHAPPRLDRAPIQPQPAPPRRPAPPTHVPAEGLSGPEQKILDELAELESIGIAEADKVQLGFFCGYTNVRSGGFSEPMGRLVQAGLVRSPRPGQVAITEEGRGIARAPGAVSTTEDLQDRILTKLDGPRAKILRELIRIYPESIDKIELGERLGYTNVRSGGFSEPIGSLKTLGMVESPERGKVQASPMLFLEEARR